MKLEYCCLQSHYMKRFKLHYGSPIVWSSLDMFLWIYTVWSSHSQVLVCPYCSCLLIITFIFAVLWRIWLPWHFLWADLSVLPGVFYWEGLKFFSRRSWNLQNCATWKLARSFKSISVLFLLPIYVCEVLVICSSVHISCFISLLNKDWRTGIASISLKQLTDDGYWLMVCNIIE